MWIGISTKYFPPNSGAPFEINGGKQKKQTQRRTSVWMTMNHGLWAFGSINMKHHILVSFYCISWSTVMGSVYAFHALAHQTVLVRCRQGIVKSLHTAAKSKMSVAAAAKQTADAWAEGKNAAPAIMCEVENVPILDPIPDG